MKHWPATSLFILSWQTLFLSPTSGQPSRADPGDLRQLQLDSVPLARIGDDPEQPLHDVRGIVVLPSGGLLIGEGSTNSLRFYDSEGALTKVVGRFGDGPGEFRRLSWVRRYGSRVYAYDSSRRRLSEFTLEGALTRAVTVHPVPPFVAALVTGVFSDGSLLVRGIPVPQPPSQPIVRRQESALLRYDRDGNYVERIGDFLGSEAFVFPQASGGYAASLPVFARASAVAVDGPNFVTVENITPDIQVRRQDGRLLERLEPIEGLEPTEVLDRDVSLMRARFLNVETPGLTSPADLFDQMPIPDSYPFWGWASWDRRPLLTLRDSLIWVLRYGGLSDEGPVWMVFDLRSARQTAVLSSADIVELWDVTGDVAGVLYRTDFDEEIVELRKFRLKEDGKILGQDSSWKDHLRYPTGSGDRRVGGGHRVTAGKKR